MGNWRTASSILAAVGGLAIASPACAEHHDEGTVAPEAVDYADAENWLCLPEREDYCSVPLTVTTIAADGSTRVEEHARAADPGFDCFYVYPTVSNDPGPHSDMTANDEERRVILLQAAPFEQVCRVYAPLYRQVTLTALRRGMAGGGWAGVDRTLPYRDVKAAWEEYLANHNDGRGVVLIGHSQGSGVLSRLIAQDINGDGEAADRVVSALLIGSNIAVAEGGNAGGQLGDMPVCSSPDQFGCAVSFVSFRSDVPPPANSRFGKVEGEGMQAICANPAALGGGSAPLDAWLSNTSLLSSTPTPEWGADSDVTTSFVSVPGMLSGECVADHGAHYLSVTVAGDPADPRTDDITGDVMFAGQRLDDWGLHLIDMNLAMGDMVDLVVRQAAAWSAARAD